MVYFIQIMHTYACQHCLTTGMRVILILADKALPSIRPWVRGQLVKTLKTTWYSCIKLCILIHFTIIQPLVCKTGTRLCRAFIRYAKRGLGFAEHPSGRPLSVSENAHNS